MFIIKSIVFYLFLFVVFEQSSYAGTKTITINLPTKFGELKIEVHFQEKDLYLAQRIEKIASDDLIKVVSYFEVVPRDVVHINIDDKLRLTNGNARNFPTNIINLYNFPANNNEHLIVLEDWWRGLLIHEFTHIVHLDQTRGVWERGRKIFGTVAKIPVAVNPRWFTEGIAVWSESHLYKAGRLNNSTLKNELSIYLRDPKSCKQIDCIDYPGNYPGGQLSYWVGAAFLEYLENLKAKTIKCLVDENSSNVPGYLNEVVSICTGQSIYTHFENFKVQYLEKNELLPDERSGIANSFGATDFQKGILKDENDLYQVERNKNSEAFVHYDLEYDISNFVKFEHPISDIGEMVQSDEDSKSILVSFNDDPNYKINNKVWKLINSETLLEEQTLKFDNDPSYVLPINIGEFSTLSYHDNRWQYKRVKFNKDKVVLISEFVFPVTDNIVFAKIINQHLVLKVYNQIEDTTSLIVADFDLSHPVVLFATKNLFEVHAVKAKSILISENNVQTEFEITDEKITNQAMPYQFNSPSTLPAILLDYPRPEHFKPHYWFLAFGASENLSSFGATTSVSDPMDIHKITVDALVYPEIEEVGGSINYSYDLNPYQLAAEYNQEYNKSSISSLVVNRTRDTTFNIKYIIEKKRITLIPSAFMGFESVSDFISVRSTKYLGGRGVIHYQANSYSETLRSMTFSTRFAIDTPSNGDSFLNLQSKYILVTSFSDDLLMDTRFAYGKLYKNNYSRGVLFAGGVSTSQTSRLFESYGIPYGNAYGNELFSGRIKFDYTAYEMNRGLNLVPVFARNFHLIGGLELLSSEVLYLNNKYYLNQTISSAFIGGVLKTILFYQAPADIELIASRVFLPNGERFGQVAFNLSAEVF